MYVGTRAQLSVEDALLKVAAYPRVRYMGSKYALAPKMTEVLSGLRAGTFLDAFSGSGFVGYLAKTLGYQVTSNDYMEYGRALASATITANKPPLTEDDARRIASDNLDGRDFIRRTFDGVFFTPDDLDFLDAAWSHIDLLDGPARDTALAALILSCSRKQARGVFTISGDLSHYDDGRRDLKMPLREHFLQAVREYRGIIIPSDLEHTALQGDALQLPGDGWDVVYLDPPYAPPSDDADYTKRYHFLEGVACYWRGLEIMPQTKTRKITKRHSAFASKRTAPEALRAAFSRFESAGALVVSYSSNSVPGLDWMIAELSKIKPDVKLIEVPHRYHFGTHKAAARREASEYIFVAQ